MKIFKIDPANIKEINAEIYDLTSRTNINEKFDFHKYTETPLGLASRSNRPDIVELLLLAKADPNQPDNSGSTPLIWASNTGNSKNVSNLLIAKADPNQPDNSRETPLICASQKGKLEIVKDLLFAKANPNHFDHHGFTPLNYAAFNFDLANAESENISKKIISILIKAGADIELSGDLSYKPLLTHLPHPKTSKLLIENGADVNTQDHHGQSALETVVRIIVRKVKNIESYIEENIPEGKDTRIAAERRDIENYEKSAAELLLSHKYGLIIRSKEQKNLVIKILQNSPLLIPHIDPILKIVNSKGQTIQFTDPDISELIRSKKANECPKLKASEAPILSSGSSESSSAAAASAVTSDFTSTTEVDEVMTMGTTEF